MGIYFLEHQKKSFVHFVDIVKSITLDLEKKLSDQFPSSNYQVHCCDSRKIDTIKKKGIIGSDTMNATLLAFSNSAAESFIVMVSIFYDLPDIGI